MVEISDFKEVMARWPAGIAVITSADGDNWRGFTANSLASVSIDPVLISVSIDKKADTLPVIQASGVFAVNILRKTNKDLGIRFAGYLPEYEDDRFRDIDVTLSENGCPLLPDMLAWLDCRVYQSVDLNASVLFLGEVTGAYWEEEGEPLAYWNRQWGGFQAID